MYLKAVDGKVADMIEAKGITPVMSLPCMLLSGVIAEIDRRQAITHIPVCREEEGVGIAAGAALAGKRPLILMQNSGLGNAVNALMSLTFLYRLPLFLMMSHRGGTTEKIAAQVPMGEAAPKILDALQIEYLKIESVSALDTLSPFLVKTFDENRIGACFLDPGLWT